MFASITAWTTGSAKRSRAFFVSGVAGRPAFRRFWFGQSVSQLGSAVSNAALPLIAAIILHASPFQMGLLVALETIPSLIFTIPSGVFADRRDRRHILIAADVARAAVIFLVPLGAITGHLSFELMAFVAFALGALTVLFDISIESFMPEIVPEADLIEGFQHMEVASSGSSIFGASLGGILLGTVGVFLTVLIDALSYVVSVVSLLFIRRQPDLPAPVAQEPAGVWQELWAGLRLVLGNRILRDLAISTALLNLGNGFMLALLVLFATRNLGLNAAEFGVLYAISNIGFLLGVTMVRYTSQKLGSGRALTSSVLLSVGAVLMIPLATPGIGITLLVVGRFMNAMAVTTYNILLKSTRQTLSPPAFRGRITGSFRLISWGVLPIGSLLGGALGGVIGVTQTMWVAVLFFIAAVLVLRVGPVWKLDIANAST